MNLVLLGPSGVGKGTHADGLAARHQLRHLATGDLFRRNVRERTALGLLARKYMAQSELVPDEVVDAMIEEWADTLPDAQGMLFDGFPRTADQVRFLDELLSRLHRNFDGAIYLHVDDDERKLRHDRQAERFGLQRLPLLEQGIGDGGPGLQLGEQGGLGLGGGGKPVGQAGALEIAHGMLFGQDRGCAGPSQ